MNKTIVAQQAKTSSFSPPDKGVFLRYAKQVSESLDTAPASVDRVSTKSGKLLEPTLRLDMEQRFGHDFSQVQVHMGSIAEQSAQDGDAQAYTVGRDIVFRSGHYAPDSLAGKRLLAHELTHAVQQQSDSDGIRVGHSNVERGLSSILPNRTSVTAPSIQFKLTISSPDDSFEREADDVADRVMRMVETGPIGGAQAGLQRKCAECEEEEEENSPAAASLQSIEGGEEELLELSEVAVQRKAEFGAAVAASSPCVADRLAKTQSGGESLASGTRHPMEAAFGRDFSRVRVHRDSEAAELNRQLSAVAFTHGSHIYFGSGSYDPEGSSGKRLLAHELTHVVQQGHAVPDRGHNAAPIATAVQTATPPIQRAATWAAPAVHETNNLADTALAGADAGATIPTINGAIGGALNAPTVTVTPVAAGGFDATVTTVPANTLSVDQTVLAPGPWRRVVPRATIGARFPTLAQCTGAANSNFRARGNPSDAAMFAANRRHEDRHAADGRAAFNGSIVPWDARLTTANTAGTTFHGATDVAARAALFTGMGGTVAQIRTAFVTAWNAAIPVYHGTPAGGPIGAPTDPTAAPNCSWSFARYSNPS